MDFYDMCFMGKRWHMDVYGMASHHPSHNRNPHNYVYLDPYENGLMNMAVFPWQYGIATIDRCSLSNYVFFLNIFIVHVRYVSLLEGNYSQRCIYLYYLLGLS